MWWEVGEPVKNVKEFRKCLETAASELDIEECRGLLEPGVGRRILAYNSSVELEASGPIVITAVFAGEIAKVNARSPQGTIAVYLPFKGARVLLLSPDGRTLAEGIVKGPEPVLLNVSQLGPKFKARIAFTAPDGKTIVYTSPLLELSSGDPLSV